MGRAARQGRLALLQSPMDHAANFIQHLHEPGVVLNPTGLKQPPALISRSLQIGEENATRGRWKLLMLMDGQGREERVWVGKGVCAGREAPGTGGRGWHTWVPLLESSTLTAPSGLVLS